MTRVDVDDTGRATYRPGVIATALGMLAIAAVVGLLIIIVIAYAAQRGDDVRATRHAVETIKPCRP